MILFLINNDKYFAWLLHKDFVKLYVSLWEKAKLEELSIKTQKIIKDEFIYWQAVYNKYVKVLEDCGALHELDDIDGNGYPIMVIEGYNPKDSSRCFYGPGWYATNYFQLVPKDFWHAEWIWYLERLHVQNGQLAYVDDDGYTNFVNNEDLIKKFVRIHNRFVDLGTELVFSTFKNKN